MIDEVNNNFKSVHDSFSDQDQEDHDSLLKILETDEESNVSLSKESILIYYMNNYWDAKSESGIRWNDKKLKIHFPYRNLIISKKDRKLKTFDFFKKNKKTL